MITGSGLIATSFKKYTDELQGICIYASGVANSSCTDKEEFQREQQMLQATLASIPEGEQLAYFSTCSVHDPLLAKSAYVLHKLKMESLVLTQKGGHVFRLPQLAGNSANRATLLNYLSTSIDNNSPIKIWSKAERNIIDVEDVAYATMRYISSGAETNKITNLCNPRATEVLEIVKTLEKVKGKAANMEIIDGGSHYDIPMDRTELIYSQIGLKFPKKYLENVLQKYYSS